MLFLFDMKEEYVTEEFIKRLESTIMTEIDNHYSRYLDNVIELCLTGNIKPDHF